MNILTPESRSALAMAAARESSLTMDEGQMSDDTDAVQVAWNTFKNSKDEDVLKLLNAYDPKEIELNITKAEDDLKVLGLEEKNEKKINKALLKPHGPPNP
eukprot:CAMPEP_0172192936 /NCGR_PEP_ID=MMETSP1050-20130122/24644_1 /TAXON_ID=233186 /ORGANISM="Cryptomonas curvata, Strain CCAP979/52" /LENGTH=100 /DNA_ID=CAMNT_0012868373 /DNA_START=248 /DNA_END=550 /DNA_ORIENTATION=-